MGRRVARLGAPSSRVAPSSGCHAIFRVPSRPAKGTASSAQRRVAGSRGCQGAIGCLIAPCLSAGRALNFARTHPHAPPTRSVALTPEASRKVAGPPGRTAPTGRLHTRGKRVKKLSGRNRRRLPVSFRPARGCIPRDHPALRMSAARRSISPREQKAYCRIIVDILPITTVYAICQ
jgi:hypothetical protein